jgi:hypothetical protein
MDGRVRRNGGSSRLIRDKFPLSRLPSLVGRGTTPGQSGKKIQNRDHPRAQISDEIVSEAREVLRKGR